MLAYLTAVAVIALIYMLLTVGLNLQYGYTGLINFGHVAFYAVGAYTSALLSLAGWPLYLTFPVAVLAAMLVAAPIGLLSLRLSDDYLAIVTLGFSEVVRIVIQEEDWLTQGVNGLSRIPRLFGELGNSGMSDLATMLLLIACNVVAVLLILHLVRSPYGRLIQAIRDDQVAVEALGKDPSRFKVQIFLIGSGMAGLAGAFYAHFVGFLSPELFIPLVTFYAWIAMIVGGAGRTGGVVLGTLLLMALLEGSRFLRDVIPWVSEVQMASLRLAVVGLVLILFTIYRPEGLLGKRKG